MPPHTNTPQNILIKFNICNINQCYDPYEPSFIRNTLQMSDQFVNMVFGDTLFHHHYPNLSIPSILMDPLFQFYKSGIISNLSFGMKIYIFILGKLF